MSLKLVTLTGADNNTSLEDISHLSKEFPFVEWGILVSPTTISESRYPDYYWIDELVSLKEKENINISLHLCGDHAWDLSKGKIDSCIRKYFDSFDRIQLNLDGKNYLFLGSKFESLRKDYKETPFIIGTNFSEVDFDSDFFTRNDLLPLSDSSGGRGILGEWNILDKASMQGFAGGLGPENIKEQLWVLSHNLAKNKTEVDYWIDMETNIRSEVEGEVLLDISKCEQVLDACRILTY